jgi:hypothetical protein
MQTGYRLVNGRIWGPSGSTDYRIVNNYIWGPGGNSGYRLVNDHIWGRRAIPAIVSAETSSTARRSGCRGSE